MGQLDDMAQASLRREALTCQICEDLLKDPATLPCGHSFCLDCIQRHWDFQTSCSCPRCSETFSPRPPLSKNTVLAKLMAGLRAPPADSPEEQQQSYDFLSPGNTQTPLQLKEAELQRLQQEAQDIRCYAQRALQVCEGVFKESALLLEKRRSEVEQKICSEQENQLRRVQELQDHLERDISELRESFSAMSLTPDNKHSTPYTPLLSTDTLGAQARVGFESISLDVFSLGQKLQVTLGEFNLSGSEGAQSRASRSPRRDKDQTGASGSSGKVKDLNESSKSSSPGKGLQCGSEPSCREEFLKYRKIITVNKYTANEWLNVYDGFRKVYSSDKPLLKTLHPERFKYIRQVLSNEELTGRCYFELEWCMWEYGGMDVALSYFDIRRDDCGDDCLFGYNDKSWALRCEVQNYSFLFNKVCTKIPDPVGNRIGIYLDHDAGVLCFYRVQGENMRLLHRVQTHFTQPLHVGARLWGYAAHVLFLDPSIKESLVSNCVIS